MMGNSFWACNLSIIDFSSAHATNFCAFFLCTRYGSPNRLHLVIDKDINRLKILGPKQDSRRMPLATRHSIAPIFVHYNGGAKLSRWNPEISRTALYKALFLDRLRRTCAEKNRTTNKCDEGLVLGELDVLFNRHVRVIDSSYREVSTAVLSDTCPSGM